MESSTDALAVALIILAALLLCVETSEVLPDSKEHNDGVSDSKIQVRSENFSRSKRNNSEVHVDKWFQPNIVDDEDYWDTLFGDGVEEHVPKSDASVANIIQTSETPHLSLMQPTSRRSVGFRVDHSYAKPGPHIGRSLPEPGTWFGPRVGRSNPDPGMWFGPRVGRSHPEPGMWFGPRVGRSHPEPAMWFGPRIGRSSPEPGMWFGPRVGRSHPEPGMWFGPRVGRSRPEPGTWFGPRVGRSHPEPGMWFGPRVGRSHPEPGMWFGPRVGRSYPEPGMWFGPRVGRSHSESELRM
nr:tryptopyrokinin 2 [Schistocerca gregaria]